MKKILGLDLGTNSIGWALIEKEGDKGNILGLGSRIIPMSQDVLGKFDSGVSISQTAERTGFRGIRRLRERHLLRRERLHRVLNILGFLPEHYSKQIDFEKHKGQFTSETVPKLCYVPDENNKAQFLFGNSFQEMLSDFKKYHPDLLEDGKKVPYDWTIYYLRKKALREKIEKEELAWLLLHFNQKRGYYQLRGEDEDDKENKKEEFFSLEVVDVVDSGDRKGTDEVWYNVHLENGWIYRRTSKVPLDWVGKVKDFIVTTEYDEDGAVKIDKEGKEKRSFRAPKESDWGLQKKKAEHQIEEDNSDTVGEYIYSSLLKNPAQKIKGKLIRVIERKFYVDELLMILDKQANFHPELRDEVMYNACIKELYQYNEAHKESLSGKGFVHLFLNDIIFYQRPLKSKKSLISNCKFEERVFVLNGEKQRQPLKGIAKSHPLYQEFRLWQFIQNLRIYKKDGAEDIDVTEQYLKSGKDITDLFDWLNDEEKIDQKALLKKHLKIKNITDYKWNYIEDKSYPANETRAAILKRLKKANVPLDFLTHENEVALWHILYSVVDKTEIKKALQSFSERHGFNSDFVDHFKKFPPYKNEYGAYSEKALKKLLPLMRTGKYWNESDIVGSANLYQKNRAHVVANIKEKEAGFSEEDLLRGKTVNRKLLETLLKFQDDISEYSGVELHIASYLVYGRHSEDSDVLLWKKPKDIACYLKAFKQHSLRNPIVEQVITETLRVVKDIWEHFGEGREKFFDEIHIELGREMKSSADKRKKMTNQIKSNENTNLRIKALLTELKNSGQVEGVRPYSPMQQEILKIYEEGVLSAEEGNVPDDILKISRADAPTSIELKKYKLWLEQGYRSPYTGKIIPLSKLFTSDYEIEHVIPQSRYFDDSLSNKVICEAEVNANKGNRTAYEYMNQRGGEKVSLNYGNDIRLLSIEEYEELVKKDFGRSRSKMKKLLMEEIPEDFIARQLNDSRYISKVVKSLLSNVVREEGELEAISKNVVPVTGAITARMKRDWGLEHVWNELITPRFIRMNELKGTDEFGKVNENTNKFLPTVPLVNQKGFSKKRIDHRHHALDALAIACITKNHVNYLNSINSKRKNYSLVAGLRVLEEIVRDGEKVKVAKSFLPPWPKFAKDAIEKIEKIIVSYKQNLRVINKTVNYYQRWKKTDDGTMKKVYGKQVKGDHWAIRKPMHKDTVSGLVKLKLNKEVSLSTALGNWEMISDRALKSKIKELVEQKYDKKKIARYFKEIGHIWNEKDVSRVQVDYWDVSADGAPSNVAVRVPVDDSFNTSKINSITDSGIRAIMKNHLHMYNEEKGGKTIEHPELAFSQDGLDKMNKNIAELNCGKQHQPIYKVRTYEPKGSKFNVGHYGNKADKYVEAAKGTNLFFAIYEDGKGKRLYDTIPLNIVIERQKQGLSPVPEADEKGNTLIMFLSPNDLVYVPSEESEDRGVGFAEFNKEYAGKVYRMVSATGSQCFFVRNDIAAPIVNKEEFSPLNKMERSIEGVMIKEVCVKLSVDRLGNIIKK